MNDLIHLKAKLSTYFMIILFRRTNYEKLLTVAAIALSSVAVYNTAIAQGFNDGHKHNTQQGFVDESVIVKPLMMH